jgi:hypothetical protein
MSCLAGKLPIDHEESTEWTWLFNPLSNLMLIPNKLRFNSLLHNRDTGAVSPRVALFHR